ncbi:MAG: hypothetical protein IT281_00055 [Ignavibacteria bacterium]|nr:hypothetical protein [Ignavibacteria bacterium]MCC7157910.1 hypothetical protein [Ignavibacteria bacterium]
MTLLELCYIKPEQILLDSTNCLVRAHLPHYEKFRKDGIHDRFSNLLQALTKCIEVNSCTDMLTYMNKLSDERFIMGFELQEVQTAINIFEESMWKSIAEFVDQDKQFAAMKLVTCILGKAKEELTGEYALLSRSDTF